LPRAHLALVAGVLLSAAVLAQPGPQQQPLVRAEHLVYLGSFRLPTTDGTNRAAEQSSLHYGGMALGIGPNGQSLYYGCHTWHSMLAQVTIPEIGGTAAIMSPSTPIRNLAAIDPDRSETKTLGGSLAWNGRTVVSAYTFYDGSGNATASHFAGRSLAELNGPSRLSGASPGMVGGYMGEIPREWRALLGGPALTGLCCTAIISRSSYGPAVSVFDPDQVGGQNPVPSTLLVGYPEGHATLGAWNGNGPLFNGATQIGGVAFPAGTRSVLFIGRHGDTFCYGEGAVCRDPTDASKGNHAYPYRHQVWAYDASDLVAVKQGAKKPWDVRPYATWTLTDISTNGEARMSGVAYDPLSRRIYVTAERGSATPRVHVYLVSSAIVARPEPDESDPRRPRIKPGDAAAPDPSDGSRLGGRGPSTPPYL
jgi:hypothetical protein